MSELCKRIAPALGAGAAFAGDQPAPSRSARPAGASTSRGRSSGRPLRRTRARAGRPGAPRSASDTACPPRRRCCRRTRARRLRSRPRRPPRAACTRRDARSSTPTPCRRAARDASRQLAPSRRRRPCRARPREPARRAARRCRRRGASRPTHRRAAPPYVSEYDETPYTGNTYPCGSSGGVSFCGLLRMGGKPFALRPLRLRAVVGVDGACRQRRCLARLRIRLGVADLNLALRRQAAVIGGEEDVERRHDVVLARRRLVDALALLLERDRIAPVGELDLLVRRRCHGLPEHDEIAQARRTDVARCAGGAPALVCVSPVTADATMSPLKSDEGRDLRGRACARLRTARRRHARRDGAGAHDGTVGRVRERSVESDGIGRRIELARADARLPGDDHLDRPRAGDRPRLGDQGDRPRPAERRHAACSTAPDDAVAFDGAFAYPADGSIVSASSVTTSVTATSGAQASAGATSQVTTAFALQGRDHRGRPSPARRTRAPARRARRATSA